MQEGLRTTGDIQVLKKIVSPRPGISKHQQCKLLGLNWSSLYYTPVGESEENLEIMRKMDEEFLEHPTKGVEGMVDFLFALGIVVGPKRVRRLLRKMSIMAIYPKRNLSKLGKAKYIHSYKLLKLEFTHSNQAWCIDITHSVPGSLRDFIAVTRVHLKSALLLQLCLVVQAYKSERQ